MKKYINLIFILVTIVLLAFIIINLRVKNPTKVFFVAINGNDSNPGSKDKPLATFEGAQNAIRKFKIDKKNKLKPIIVYIRSGIYYRKNTFIIDNRDSGDSDTSITYQSYKNENVIITGGVELDKDKFSNIKNKNILDRIKNKNLKNQILEYNLKSNHIDYGNTSQNIMDAPELFFNDRPLTLARWPNENYDLTGNIISNTNSNYTFQYNKLRVTLWEDTKDAWLFGYWYHNWADFVVRMDSIDIKNQLITFKQNINYGIKSNQRYFAFNLLQELDRPGEWYFDRTKGKIYIYPPASMDKGTFYMSQLNKPFIAENNTSNVHFKRIVFEANRSTAIVINGGKNNTIEGCTIRNISKNAVTINGGKENGVQSCDIYNTGSGGIIINGGDRNKLIAANNYADNNNIYNYSRIKRTYTPAISLGGVGNIASHNSIHDAPHTAILFSGNNHIIQYNDIYSVANETDDVGAIYTGRNWTYRGNVIRYNYIHDMENSIGKAGRTGVYLDDCMSSAEVYGNVFYKVNRAILVGGGRDNKIYNNIIIIGNESIRADERGLRWNLDSLFQNLDKSPYRNEIWKKEYPNLYKILDDSTPGIPVGNTVEANAIYMTKKPSIAKAVVKNGNVSNNILFTNQPDFISNGQLDFRKLSKETIPISNFKVIPFNKIGIYKDDYSMYRNFGN